MDEKATKDDLIFGYTFDEIESAQRGGRLGRAVDTSKPAGEDSEERKRADLLLLEKHGLEKLREMHYFGVIDRLCRAGYLD